MLDFLFNPWVVGIGGGLISSIIVFYLSNFIMNRKNNSEYTQRVELANTEVINMLKPYVADNGLPQSEVLDAIISSTSRKHKVKKAEMFSIAIFCQELIREIIENVYVSNEKKDEYTKQLSTYIISLEKDIIINVQDRLGDIKADFEYRRNLSKQYSLMLAIITMMGSIGIALLGLFENEFANLDSTLNIANGFNIYFLIITILLACVIPIIMTFILIELKKRRSKELQINAKNSAHDTMN